MVRRTNERREDEVVRGSKGNRVLRSLYPLREFGGHILRRGDADSMDVITSLFLSITRFCTRDFRVSGESVP